MSLIDKVLPARVKDTLNKIFPDTELRRDLNTVLAQAVPAFKEAGSQEATDGKLREVFNDVAQLLPLIQHFLDKGKLPGTFEAIGLAATYGSLLTRMNGNDLIEKTFQNPGPELLVVYDKLLAKENVQEALKRVLLKPVGQDVLKLQEEGGKFYAAESLSGANIKFPVREDIYKSVQAAYAAKNQPPPKGPSI